MNKKMKSHQRSQQKKKKMFENSFRLWLLAILFENWNNFVDFAYDFLSPLITQMTRKEIQ